MNGPSEPPAAASKAPTVAGVRVRPTWAVLLYVLLVASAALALYAQRSAGVDPAVARAAPWAFLGFAVGFAVYRVALVAARRYSPFKAFFQIFVAALFFVLLLFPRVAPAPVEGLFAHREAAVRAQAAELAGWRNDVSVAPALVALLADGSPEVRRAAHGALVRLNGGADLGGPESADARGAWRARFP